MKKKYYAPEMEIVKVEVQKILTGSIPVNGTTNDASSAEAPEHEWYDWQF